MNIAIILFPGTNREHDMARALKIAGCSTPDIIWHKDRGLTKQYDLIIIPGGFSFGDYLRTGALAAHSPIMGDVIKAAKQGVSIFGVCNGFQILIEAGLLPGILMRNKGLNFLCKQVALHVETNDTRFTTLYENKQSITIPIAHHDGNYYASKDELERLEGEGQIVFRYGGRFKTGQEDKNPNGSQNDIAGIINQQGNILGMMPHPENAIEAINHTQDGLALFQSIITFLKG